MAVAFDDAAMGADDLGDQRQAKPRSVRLGGDEGIEEIGEEIGRNAGTIVDHAEFQRQRYLLESAGNRKQATRELGRRKRTDMRRVGKACASPCRIRRSTT